jgi:hypothetical protein
MTTKAFISYSTIDRHFAAVLKQHLERAQITAFMAHEDIQVSEEWRLRLLRELRSNDMFICLLSQHYLNSAWCMQESGVAAFRKGLVIVPLRLDDTLPPGFLSSFQATPFDPDDVQLSDLGSAIVRVDFETGVEFLLTELKASKSFRAGESNLQAILPHVERMSEVGKARLLNIAANTYRVSSANLCISDLLPPLVRKYGHLGSPEDLAKLKKACQL